ncbi:hypothetical protein BT69DRAFT_1279108 [Atractiella rhizophila]|nr:hypothetical protein BT69DRAFT_1279108 [Atractiella rhizophila]
MPVYGGLIVNHATILEWAEVRLPEEDPEEVPEGSMRHPLWCLKLARNDVSSYHVRILPLPCAPDTPEDQYLYVIACGQSAYQGFTNKSFAALGYDQSKVPIPGPPSPWVSFAEDVLKKRGLQHEGYKSVFVLNYTAKN